MPQFEDITIVGREECTMHAAPVEPQLDEVRGNVPIHPSMVKRCIHLKLSKQPPEVWRRMFTTRWSDVQDVGWRPARVEGDVIVVEAPEAEFDTTLLAFLELAVKDTNTAYRE